MSLRTVLQAMFRPCTVTEDLGGPVRSDEAPELVRALGGSLQLRHVDAGSCNGCELEIASAFGPVYDAERFGVRLVASPRHADGVLVTGPVTKNMAGPLVKTVEAMPQPGYVIALGDCARDCGVFRGGYAVEGAVAHKGIERLFEGRAVRRGIELAERISGDSAVGHGLAFCLAVEEARGMALPTRGHELRAVLLELERLYNHVADIGALCNDVGFGLANARALTLRERLLQLNAEVTGHRLLRGAIFPGGVELARLPRPDELEDIGVQFRDLTDAEPSPWSPRGLLVCAVDGGSLCVRQRLVASRHWPCVGSAGGGATKL